MNSQKMYYLYYNSHALSINNVGEQNCAPNHFNGPKSREPFIFHFVVSGEGRFKIHGKEYHLTANQGFLIPDRSVIFYQSELKNPWYYCWFQISGSEAEHFFERLSLSPENPIYNAKADNLIFNRFKSLIFQANQPRPDRNLVFSALFQLFSELEHSSTTVQKIKLPDFVLYAQKAESYILDNYHHENFSISEVADYVGLNRSYLSRLFRNHFQISPMQYLLRHRMTKAKMLLQEGLPVNIVASSVGYNDLATFSKAYKHYFGVSPSKLKNRSPF